MKSIMKSIVKFLSVLFLISVLVVLDYGKKAAPEAEVELPWVYCGYTNLNQFHLRYYYIFWYAIDEVLTGEKSWDESIKDNTCIVEVWYKSDGRLLRRDRYIEKLDAICKSYEGEPPATITYNGKTYSLHDRIIQKGLHETTYTFRTRSQIDYDYEKNQAICDSGYYDKYESEAYKESDPGLAITYMTAPHTSRAGVSVYAPKSADSKEIETSGFGLMKMIQPAKYNKIIEGWNVKENIAGRTAVKNYNSPPSFWGAEGYQFIDIELGIGLAGYLEGCRASDTYKETKFEEPKLVYKALLVETTVSPDVFEKF